MSSMERAMSPSVSSEPAASFTPTQRRSPHVGRYANAPQKLAGRIVEPVVCVPIASGTIESPTAAAEPLEDPPGVRLGSNGLRVLPGYWLANSVVTVLPIRIAPALRPSATHAASAFGWCPA